MTHPYRALVVSVGLVGLLVSGQRKAAAFDLDFDRETLRGLTGVLVAVQALDEQKEQAGLTKEQIKTDVEQRLRKAGIRVLRPEEWEKAPGSPSLYVTIHLLKQGADPIYALSLRIELKQAVLLARNPEVKNFAATWSTGTEGFIGRDKLQEIRSSIAYDVDRFVNAYLAVNSEGNVQGHSPLNGYLSASRGR